MNKVGTRVVYDDNTKDIVTIQYPMQGDVNHRGEWSLKYLDIDFDGFDPMTQRIESVDSLGNAVIVSLPLIETEEQRKIRELEDILLLQADSELGGIL